MLAELTHSTFFLAALALATIGAILLIAGIVALFRAHIATFILRTLLATTLLATGMLSGMIALGIQGYKTLTHEEVVARISVSPLASQRFAATFRYPDGQVSNFIIAGDEIYIDAHILKWQPVANMLGLHTAYELDRVGGRYRDIEQERTAERTLQPLGKDKVVNLFKLRQLYTVLSVLFDAKYGSATFVPVTQAAELELRVSTSGLLIREMTNPLAQP